MVHIGGYASTQRKPASGVVRKTPTYVVLCAFGCMALLGTRNYPDAIGIANGCGMKADEWIEYTKNNPAGMVSDIMGYYSNDDVFGSNAYGSFYTEQQIRKRLNRALA